MTIGEAAAASGVSAKMIRYYESVGLVAPAAREANGFRVYGGQEVHTLAVVRRARRLGFSVEQIGRLLRLWRDRGRASAEVKRIAEGNIAELEAMRRTLEHLLESCHGHARPDCPILADLAQGAG
jgi:MerR family transcriptional regulator, copper efflux regulator